MPPLTAHTAWATWQFAPVVTGLLVVPALLYLAGAGRVRRRHPVRPWSPLRTASFLGGLLVVALATESSIGAYDRQLFWVHMVQHLLLIMVAPPLLVAGRPVILLMHAVGQPVHGWVRSAVRSRVVSVLTCPPVALVVYTATIAGTHLTSFMNVVLRHPIAHDAEHLLYLVAGYFFFLPLLGSEPIRWRLSYPARFLLLVVAMPVDTFVGVVFTQANHELFSAYVGIRSWGPSLVDDLHAGGAVMWVGGDALMLLFLFLVCLGFVRDRRAKGTAGRFLEAARRSALDGHAAAAGLASTTGRRPARSIDDDDAELAAYNDYLAALARRGSRPG